MSQKRGAKGPVERRTGLDEVDMKIRRRWYYRINEPVTWLERKASGAKGL